MVARAQQQRKVPRIGVLLPGTPASFALRAKAFLEGLLLLRQAIGTERRPLSWVVGPQETTRAPLPSMRDLLQPSRKKMTVLRETDEI